MENKHIFNSAVLEDHHALIPLAPLPSDASDREKNIYIIVAKSFFTVCMPDMIWNEKKLLIKNGEYTYLATLKEILEEGWTRVGDKEEKETKNEAQQVRQFDEKNCRIASAAILDKQTSPPKEFRIDTLLAFMENPKNEESSSRLAGLGTPATRAEIIKALFTRNYIGESGKNLRATPKGLFLLKQLKADDNLRKIADVGQTTEWEQQLQADPGLFEQAIVDFVRSCIKPKNPAGERWEGVSAGICPLCGNKVLEGKKGWYCSAWNSTRPCTFTIRKEAAGAPLKVSDIQLLLAKKKTPVKYCTSKNGKTFKAAFVLDDTGKLQFQFNKSRGKYKKGAKHG
jgi:DNA topoisomerase-3